MLDRPGEDLSAIEDDPFILFLSPPASQKALSMAGEWVPHDYPSFLLSRTDDEGSAISGDQFCDRRNIGMEHLSNQVFGEWIVLPKQGQCDQENRPYTLSRSGSMPPTCP